MDDLLRVKTLLSAGVPIPADLVNWLVPGIDKYYSGQSKTLCGALGLRRPGHSSHATCEKIKNRNDWLKNIAQLYPGTPWQQATMIETQLKRYPYLPPEEKALYGYLLSLDVKLPGLDGIYKILAKN